jgi:hypothetical protein
MTIKPDTSPSASSTGRHFLAFCLLLFVLLSLLFLPSYSHDQVLSSNDAPLGLLTALAGTPCSTLTGQWVDLNWLGSAYPSALPDVSQVLYALLGPTTWHQAAPILFAKFYAPAALFLIGLCAWALFRQLKFHPAVCTIAAIAAALNTDPFSNACWGLPSWAVCHAMVFLTLAILVSLPGRFSWIKVLLAGATTGMAIMEGYDSGAIYSLFIGAFVVFLGFADSGDPQRGLLQGGLRLVVLAVFSALIAAQALFTLIGTQIQGVTSMEQDAQTKQMRWVDATQWSLPKIETLRVIIPGLFGYRMDTPNGGSYWGTVGQREGWNENHLGGPRSSGSGEFAGVPVALFAAWAIAQSLRKKGSPYSDRERRIVGFWAVAATLALVLAWGRHAPLYRLFYSIPYGSVIRNPIKFMHPFEIAISILFAFGLEAVVRLYGTRAMTPLATRQNQLRNWWKSLVGFEKKWFWGMIGCLALSLFGLLLFAASRTDILGFMTSTGFNPEIAETTFRFSLKEIYLFLLVLLFSVGLLVLAASGLLGGPRIRVVLALLGLLVAADLARANLPWIVYLNYSNRYASNPILDQLRQRPFEHRVKMYPYRLNDNRLNSVLGLLQDLYGYEWLQLLFPFYGIQSLDVVMEPRTSLENSTYRAAFNPTDQSRLPFLTARLWELTNTRYLLGLSGDFINVLLNPQFDTGKNRFRLHTAFEIATKPGSSPTPGASDLTAVAQPEGRLALIEFTGALPRAKLYSHWEVMTNSEAALQRLTDPAFDPHQTVLVSETVPAVSAADNAQAGTVEYTQYSRMHFTLKAKAGAAAILLVNDRYNADWRIRVDGQPQPLFRCNYLMRGVLLQPGEHTVEFDYQPHATALWVSVAAIGLSLVLGLTLVLLPKRTALSDLPTPATNSPRP